METWDLTELSVEPHKPQVLHSDDDVRAIAIHLPAGEELQEHQVHEGAYLVVVEGEIEVSAGDGSMTGGVGFMSHFERSERHAVKAVSDARMVLLLAPWPGAGHPSRRDG